MPPLALLSLLGAAALAGVSSMPMEKDHVEEMVTRCIVEVLSTALSKPNAPPINPLCKDILKKISKDPVLSDESSLQVFCVSNPIEVGIYASSRHKAEKKNENEEEQLEVRHLKESSEDEKHQHVSVEEERSQKEENEEKHHHEEDESRGEEEKHNGDSHSHENRVHKGEKNHHLDIRGEEEKDDDDDDDDNSYKRNNHSEEGSKEKKHHAEESGEAEHELPDKRSHSVAKSMEEFSPEDDKHSVGHRHSEEKINSNEKRSHESEEEEEEEEEEEQSSERNHHESKEHGSYQYRGREESEESEEAEEEKRRYKPRHSHRKHRVGDSSKERRDHEGEKRNPLEESSEEENRFWDKKSHYQKHHYEEPEHHREEKRNYYGKHSSEDVEEKRHTGRQSEEYREQWHQNKNSEEEEEEKRHYLSKESEEERHEKKRNHDKPHEAVRHHYEGRKHHSEESEEELDKHHGHSSRGEKRHHGESRHHFHDREDEIHRLHSGESKGQLTGHYSTEEQDSEEKRHYPGYDEVDAEIEKRHDSEDQNQDNEDSMEKGRYGEKEYKSHVPTENEKRATIQYSPFYHRLQWKSRHLDKKDNMGDQILGSEQESRPNLNEKNFFPEYDYDWWEKKQLLDGLNHGHGEKRNLGRLRKLDMKRQYDRMDQLAQLLNYRKKSVEFPELYNSGEDLKKRHLIRSDKGNLSQRPLTEEEEKELENLAAMDLELQKIAEKFNDNRRG